MKSPLMMISVCFLAACAPDITDPFQKELGPPPTLSVVSGQGQVVPLGGTAVVRVRMLNADATPAVNTSVQFLALETIPNQIGGGSSTWRNTDATGVAEFSFTTTRLGPFTVTASLSECATYYLKECPKWVLRASATVTGTIVAAN